MLLCGLGVRGVVNTTLRQTTLAWSSAPRDRVDHEAMRDNHKNGKCCAASGSGRIWQCPGASCAELCCARSGAARGCNSERRRKQARAFLLVCNAIDLWGGKWRHGGSPDGSRVRVTAMARGMLREHCKALQKHCKPFQFCNRIAMGIAIACKPVATGPFKGFS